MTSWRVVRVLKISISWPSLYGFAVYGYVLSGLMLSGLPGWSRLVFVFVALLAVLSTFDLFIRNASFGKWMLLPLPFVVLACMEGVAAYPTSHDAIIRFLGTWVGSLLVGDAVRRGVPVRIVINALLLASFANAIAAISGFDAYYEYTATAEQRSYISAMDRRSGLVGNANLYAIQASLPLFAVLIWGRGLSKVLVALGVACAIYAVFITGSRKLLFIWVFLLLAVFIKLYAKKPWVVLVIPAMSVVMIVLILDNSGLLDSLVGRSRNVLAVDRIFLALEGKDNSILLREQMIGVARHLFALKPIFGGGLGYFAEVGGFYAYAHNNYWELAVAGGLVLLLSYYLVHLMLLIKLLPPALRRDASSAAACLLVLAILANDYGMVSYDEKIIVLPLVLLCVWVFSPNAKGMPCSNIRGKVDSV